jgi:hypothetical protein
VCVGVAGRPLILISQCSDSKSATDYTSCTRHGGTLAADRRRSRQYLSGAVTMSIHKLTAGSGYDYLTRQVAALDATAKGHVGLASYYTERGESPGVWVGSGLVGVDGLEDGTRLRANPIPLPEVLAHARAPNLAGAAYD